MLLVLIPVSIGINYMGKLFAQTLRLLLWLDSIGTILAMESEIIIVLYKLYYKSSLCDIIRTRDNKNLKVRNP